MIFWFLFDCDRGTGAILHGSGDRLLVIALGTLHRETVCSMGRSSIQRVPSTGTRRLTWRLMVFPKAREGQEAFHEPSTLVFIGYHCEFCEKVRPVLNGSDHASGTCWIYRNTRVLCDTLKILCEFETSLKKKKSRLDRPELLFRGGI